MGRAVGRAVVGRRQVTKDHGAAVVPFPEPCLTLLSVVQLRGGADSQDGRSSRRYLVKIATSAPGRVEGTVCAVGQSRSSPFSGWMDLLRLLEPGDPGPTGTRAEASGLEGGLVNGL